MSVILVSFVGKICCNGSKLNLFAYVIIIMSVTRILDTVCEQNF